ncbi:MAG: hypothetical protein ISS72_03200 [Candidatus Brocadiae bacterium]|nr:hypothetical protein [Candidatus Brocadiia bacterium]
MKTHRSAKMMLLLAAAFAAGCAKPVSRVERHFKRATDQVFAPTTEVKVIPLRSQVTSDVAAARFVELQRQEKEQRGIVIGELEMKTDSQSVPWAEFVDFAKQVGAHRLILWTHLTAPFQRVPTGTGRYYYYRAIFLRDRPRFGIGE